MDLFKGLFDLQIYLAVSVFGKRDEFYIHFSISIKLFFFTVIATAQNTDHGNNVSTSVLQSLQFLISLCKGFLSHSHPAR